MKHGILVGAALLLAACGQSPEPATSGADVRPEPIVVYLDAPGESAVRLVFDRFTDDTGIPVTIREADRAKNLDDVMSNRGAPPADVLITDNIGDIWTAGDDGALRQLGPDAGIDAISHDFFRDPDKQWFAIGHNPFVAVTAEDVVPPGSLEDLGDPAYAGKLCLVSSESPDSQALIAGIMMEHGERPAERIVRAWVQNLALAPMVTARGVLDAIEAGRCGVGIVTWRDAHGSLDRETAARGDYSNAFGVGLARHARYVESATTLLAWLASDTGFAEAAGVLSNDELNNPRHALAEQGWRTEDARLLAERARWR